MLDLPQRSRVLGGRLARPALYAKSKLVPLTPTSDISVGYSSIYKSIKLFKAALGNTSVAYTVAPLNPQVWVLPYLT